MFRWKLLGLGFAFACGALLVVTHGAARADRIVLKAACVLPASHPTFEGLRTFQREVAARSGGRVEVRLFDNSSLGGAGEIIEGTQKGWIEVGLVSSAEVCAFIPEVNALCMPYVYPDRGTMLRIWDGPVGTELLDAMGRAGFVGLAWYDAGSRNVTNSVRPVRAPEDLQGLQIRVMSNRVLMETIRGLGASPVAMSQGEVYTALELKKIDGWENNPTTVESFQMYRAGCTWFSWTRHVSIPDVLILGARVRDRLSPELLAALRDAARASADVQRAAWAEAEARTVRELSGHMTFNDVDLAPFRERVRPVYEEAGRWFGPEFERYLKRVLAETGASRS